MRVLVRVRKKWFEIVGWRAAHAFSHTKINLKTHFLRVLCACLLYPLPIYYMLVPGAAQWVISMVAATAMLALPTFKRFCLSARSRCRWLASPNHSSVLSSTVLIIYEWFFFCSWNESGSSTCTPPKFTSRVYSLELFLRLFLDFSWIFVDNAIFKREWNSCFDMFWSL